MASLTDLICTAANLIQSVIKYQEKSVLLRIEEKSKRLCIWCSSLAMIWIILLAGIGFVIAGVYILLAAATGAGIAALIVGVIISLLMAILMLVMKSSMR
jgi:hypothetical protein